MPPDACLNAISKELAAKELAAFGIPELRAGFQSPPASYGPVPFYWWTGDTLDRERIAWQLDRLSEQGVHRTVISYPHAPDGSCELGDPALFTEDWWELFRWFLDACRARGMTTGFQDYNLSGPALDSIGRTNPDMQGGQMGCTWQEISDGQTGRLTMDDTCLLVAAAAYPVVGGIPQPAGRLDLTNDANDGTIEWSSPSGHWLLTLVFAWPADFDPLHPHAGSLAARELYEPFEKHCPEHIGTTLDLFFQDELSFGGRMPFWSNHLFEAFADQKGYDLLPVLPALWIDFGSITEKIRMDFSDAVSRRIENSYFKPIFEWHESRGILFGHDNGGRGRIAEGRSYYGDYFRTMRWFSAPGCDDPKLQGERAFKGLKVNSSLAHLNDRPRVWIEAFHSSGWGTCPSEVVDAANEDLVYGASVINLHGLYYSTFGGWWEWAPPDFHFRQPYWRHSGSLSDYFTRMCWLLTRGVHRCDVAIVYPIESLDAEPADASRATVVAHMGNPEIDGEFPDDPEQCAFSLGKFLFDDGFDFDFIDSDSIARSTVASGQLNAGNARYRILVIPAMRALRHSTAWKALEFARNGGLVIAFGMLPCASDRAGREDPEFDRVIEDLFGAPEGNSDGIRHHDQGGAGILIRNGYAKVRDAILKQVGREIISSAPIQVLHRKLENADIHLLFNPAKDIAEIGFSADPGITREIWNAWTAEMTALPESGLQLAPRTAALVISGHDLQSMRETTASPMTGPRPTLSLDGHWDCTIQPTLDNRFGDFSLPATEAAIGPQARRFRFLDEFEENSAWQAPAFDDSFWGETTCSFGPQMECAGPLNPGHDSDALEGELDWQPYVFSRRWGIERDPFLTDWLSGPHGLKGVVPDEYLDFHCDTPGQIWYARASVIVDAPGDHTLVTGARCAYEVWINGRSAICQPHDMGPGCHAPWNIPHYNSTPRETLVRLQKGVNQVLVKLVQPAGQRTRAYLAFDPPDADHSRLALRWFREEDLPKPVLMVSPNRKAIRFRAMSPPGTVGFSFVSRGPTKAWANGREVLLQAGSDQTHGRIRYHAILEEPLQECGIIALRVEAPSDSHAGDALPEPLSFECAQGRIPTGNWCDHGLATYSGALEYRRTVTLPEEPTSDAWLDLGSVKATAEIRINGHIAATLVAPPWRCNIAPWLRRGGNEISITVANTLANHYSVGIPSPYYFSEQTRSGLFGPVTLHL